MFWQIAAALFISLCFLSQSFLVIWVDYKGPRGCFSEHAIILSVPLQLPGLTPGWSLDYLELEPVAQCCWSFLPAWPKFHCTPAIMHLLKPGTHSGTWCTASLGFNLGIWLGEANHLCIDLRARCNSKEHVPVSHRAKRGGDMWGRCSLCTVPLTVHLCSSTQLVQILLLKMLHLLPGWHSMCRKVWRHKMSVTLREKLWVAKKKCHRTNTSYSSHK